MSERSSNCSTISTPKAHRDVREARRNKEARVKAVREATAARAMKSARSENVGVTLWEGPKGVAVKEQCAEG